MKQVVAHIAKQNGRAPEDRGLARGSLAVVADGVTRTPPPPNPYPDPSPAAVAAEVVMSLARRPEPPSPSYALLACANAALGRLNTRLGLWGAYREGTDDLAGVVAAAAYLGNGQIDWAYIGDCGVVALAVDGTVVAMTPDDIEPLRPGFPPSELPPHVRMATIRRGYRNMRLTSGGFGVLTGERWATKYIRHGTWPLVADTTVAVFSDGARPMLDDVVLCRLLASLDTTGRDISARLRHLASTRGLTDEATIAVVRS